MTPQELRGRIQRSRIPSLKQIGDHMLSALRHHKPVDGKLVHELQGLTVVANAADRVIHAPSVYRFAK